MDEKFELLKRTYPTSKFDRYCDGYKYIMENSSINDRIDFGIVDNNLQKTIQEGERYLYMVGKENGKFKTQSVSFSNYKLIRELFYNTNDVVLESKTTISK